MSLVEGTGVGRWVGSGWPVVVVKGMVDVGLIGGIRDSGSGSISGGGLLALADVVLAAAE